MPLARALANPQAFRPTPNVADVSRDKSYSLVSCLADAVALTEGDDAGGDREEL